METQSESDSVTIKTVIDGVIVSTGLYKKEFIEDSLFPYRITTDNLVYYVPSADSRKISNSIAIEVVSTADGIAQDYYKDSFDGTTMTYKAIGGTKSIAVDVGTG